MNRKKELTPTQRRFAEEYCIDYNATRAYKAAFPNITDDNTAAVSGSHLIRNPNVERYIQGVQEDLSKLSKISALRVLLQLKSLAFTNLTDLIDADGNLKPVEELTEEQRAALSEYKKTVHEGKDFTNTTTQIKTYDKIRAIQEINKMLGYTSLNINLNTLPTMPIMMLGGSEEE